MLQLTGIPYLFFKIDWLKSSFLKIDRFNWTSWTWTNGGPGQYLIWKSSPYLNGILYCQEHSSTDISIQNIYVVLT